MTQTFTSSSLVLRSNFECVAIDDINKRADDCLVIKCNWFDEWRQPVVVCLAVCIKKDEDFTICLTCTNLSSTDQAFSFSKCNDQALIRHYRANILCSHNFDDAIKIGVLEKLCERFFKKRFGACIVNEDDLAHNSGRRAINDGEHAAQKRRVVLQAIKCSLMIFDTSAHLVMKRKDDCDCRQLFDMRLLAALLMSNVFDRAIKCNLVACIAIIAVRSVDLFLQRAIEVQKCFKKVNALVSLQVPSRLWLQPAVCRLHQAQLASHRRASSHSRANLSS